MRIDRKLTTAFMVFICSCLIWLTAYAADAPDKTTIQKKQVKEFVLQAVDYIKTHGQKAAFAEFSNKNGSFVKGSLYIFVTDFNGVGLANGNHPDFIGRSLYNIKDKTGKYATRGLLAIAKQGGGWYSYQWINPATKKIECKRAYVVPVANSIMVGSGYYTPGDC